MRKIFLIAPLFLLLASCSTFNTTAKAKKGKTKKITVLDYATEKSYILVTETILDPKKASKSSESTTTETEERKFFFSYNEKGQLINTYSYDILNSKETNPSNLSVSLNIKNQITLLTLDKDAEKLKVTYANNLLYQISHYDTEFKELVLNTLTYNKQKLPSRLQLGNTSKPHELVNISFVYDEGHNVKVSSYNNEVLHLSYDDKKYLLPGQPYYFNPFYYLTLDWLNFTNYNPKNNIIRTEDNNYIITIDYTYNNEDLPLTAKVTKTSKTNKQDSRITSENEFFYKEIAIPLKR